jgi:hypothetical protein
VVVAATAWVAAIGIAILRYRLYEIDVIIRRTLIYTTLIGSLALVYLAGIYLIDRALQAVTGQSGAFAVTLSTLAVAAIFQPLRKRIQHGVDHRFYRATYNATNTLDAFTSRLRDQIDLTALHKRSTRRRQRHTPTTPRKPLDTPDRAGLTESSKRATTADLTRRRGPFSAGTARCTGTQHG